MLNGSGLIKCCSAISKQPSEGLYWIQHETCLNREYVSDGDGKTLPIYYLHYIKRKTAVLPQKTAWQMFSMNDFIREESEDYIISGKNPRTQGGTEKGGQMKREEGDSRWEGEEKIDEGMWGENERWEKLLVNSSRDWIIICLLWSVTN